MLCDTDDTPSSMTSLQTRQFGNITHHLHRVKDVELKEVMAKEALGGSEGSVGW